MIKITLCKVCYEDFTKSEESKKFDVTKGIITECEFCKERIERLTDRYNTEDGVEYDIGDDEYKPRGKVYVIFTKEIHGFDKDIELITSKEDRAKEWVEEYNEDQELLHKEIEELKNQRNKFLTNKDDRNMKKHIEINKKINEIAWGLSANRAWYEVSDVE